MEMEMEMEIKIKMEEQFFDLIKNGSLQEIQEFYNNNPNINISADDEYAFCYACHNGRLEVAKWLLSLKPYLYVIEYDDNGNYASYRIRRKEEANWEKRKYALHLTLQEETNILYHLPIDISKTIVMFV